jgi:hypothetical protein
MINLDDKIFKQKELNINNFKFRTREDSLKTYNDLGVGRFFLEFFWDRIEHDLPEVFTIENRINQDRIFFYDKNLEGLFNITYISFICYFEKKSQQLFLFEDE